MYKLHMFKGGRMYLPKALQEKYGGDKAEFYVVDMPGRMVFLQKPKDALKELQKLLGKDKRSISEIRKEIEMAARKEAK